MSMEKVTGGVFRLRLGASNAYVVLRGADTVLVDCGLPAHAPRIVQALQALGRPLSSLRALLLTHRHLDHVGGAAELAARSSAEVVIHVADAPALEGRERLTLVRGLLRPLLEPLMAFSDGVVFRFRPPRATRAVEEGWRHDGALTLVHLPGHTPGHSGYYLEPEGVVFAGDAALHRGARLRQPSAPFTVDPAAARRAQRRLADLEAEYYCFGHGPPLHRGAAALRRLSED